MPSFHTRSGIYRIKIFIALPKKTIPPAATGVPRTGPFVLKVKSTPVNP
jgi:hypothetical protein